MAIIIIKRFPIIWKFGVHIAVAGALMTSMVWVGIMGARELKGDALAMDMAGSERMRLFKMAYLVDRLAWGGEDTAGEIKREMAVFEETLLVLRHGREMNGLASQRDRGVVQSLEANAARWTDEIRPLFTAALDAPSKGSLRETLEARGFKKRVFSFAEDINRMVRLMELASSKEVRSYITFQYLIFALLLAVALSSFVFVRKVLTTPIKGFISASNAIASGDLTKRVEIDTRDELSDLARAFNDMTDRLAESKKALMEQGKLAALGELATGIAHEIRNPLSSIKMNLMILFNKTADEAQRNADPRNIKTREHFKIALKEVDHLEKVLGALLDFARPSELFLSNEDVTDIIEASLRMAEAEIREKEANVIRRWRGPIHARIDSSKVKQALLNITLNALHAIDAQGTIIISAEERDGAIRIDVIDNGPGMDEERMKRVFEPFFTTRAGGTGLGLPLTKKLVEEHHGRVDITSAPGQGTTVTVTLPKA